MFIPFHSRKEPADVRFRQATLLRQPIYRHTLVPIGHRRREVSLATTACQAFLPTNALLVRYGEV